MSSYSDTVIKQEADEKETLELYERGLVNITSDDKYERTLATIDICRTKFNLLDTNKIKTFAEYQIVVRKICMLRAKLTGQQHILGRTSPKNETIEALLLEIKDWQQTLNNEERIAITKVYEVQGLSQKQLLYLEHNLAVIDRFTQGIIIDRSRDPRKRKPSAVLTSSSQRNHREYSVFKPVTTEMKDIEKVLADKVGKNLFDQVLLEYKVFARIIDIWADALDTTQNLATIIAKQRIAQTPLCCMRMDLYVLAFNLASAANSPSSIQLKDFIGLKIASMYKTFGRHTARMLKIRQDAQISIPSKSEFNSHASYSNYLRSQLENILTELKTLVMDSEELKRELISKFILYFTEKVRTTVNIFGNNQEGILNSFAKIIEESLNDEKMWQDDMGSPKTTDAFYALQRQ